MTQVAATPSAEHFGPHHTETGIGLCAHVVAGDRLVKTRPATPGFEFGCRREQSTGATRAVIHAGLLIVPVLTGEGSLCAVLPKHPVLFGR